MKVFTKEKEGHYIMIKGQFIKPVTIINIYMSNIQAPKYTKQTFTDPKG